ncbi:MAG: D-aminoacyl-tRNA deacylase [Bacteroidales bacterium]|nr:D-aminoacyl-tRNA deacylase [Bacteroidales bacterium]
MRVVIQRVKQASVKIDNRLKSLISKGLLILLGIEDEDTENDIDFLTKKICKLRIFDDIEGVMNLSIKDISGEILLVSQFTLHASVKKGNRPTYIRASKPDIAIPMYKKFIYELEKEFEKEIKTGEFGADMEVSLINDGPITITIDSKNVE